MSQFEGCLYHPFQMISRNLTASRGSSFKALALRLNVDQVRLSLFTGCTNLSEVFIDLSFCDLSNLLLSRLWWFCLLIPYLRITLTCISWPSFPPYTSAFWHTQGLPTLLCEKCTSSLCLLSKALPVTKRENWVTYVSDCAV